MPWPNGWGYFFLGIAGLINAFIAGIIAAAYFAALFPDWTGFGPLRLDFGVFLREANLFGLNLAGANLFGANLELVNLEGADLRVANLKLASLNGVNLAHAVPSAGAWPLGVTLVSDFDSRRERASLSIT